MYVILIGPCLWTVVLEHLSAPSAVLTTAIRAVHKRNEFDVIGLLSSFVDSLFHVDNIIREDRRGWICSRNQEEQEERGDPQRVPDQNGEPHVPELCSCNVQDVEQEPPQPRGSEEAGIVYRHEQGKEGALNASWAHLGA